MFPQTQTQPATKQPSSRIADIASFLRQHLRLVIFAGIIILIVFALAIYLNSYYRATNSAAIDLKSDHRVSVKTGKDFILFDGPSEENALIFYPGAHIEYTAYAPLMHKLAQNNFDCYLVKMPLNFAFLGKNKADKIRHSDAEYANWYIGGHALGGSIAADFVSNHSEDYAGLILLSAYSSKTIDGNLTVVQIYGSEDKILNRSQLQKNAVNLPNATVEEIPGANHAQFGNYGTQFGDGEATINTAAQQVKAVNIIENALLAH